jgi:RNA polymerase sigma-70 factor (ECF subfamily)
MSSKSPLEPVDFVTLWSHHARRVHAYILTLVHNVADADDLLQETGATLWEKYHEFEPGTDFGAWAARTTYYHDCNSYRKRRPLQPLDETLYDLLTTEAAGLSDLLELRFEALACSAKRTAGCSMRGIAATEA